MAKDELVLEGAVLALQDAHAVHLGDATAHPLTESLAEVLNVAGDEIRPGVALDQSGACQSEGHSSLMAFQPGRCHPFLAGVDLFHPIDPGHAIVQAKAGGVDLEPTPCGQPRSATTAGATRCFFIGGGGCKRS